MNHDPKGAIALLEREYAQRPTDVRVWREMAAVMVDQKDYRAASRVLKALCEAEPQNAEPGINSRRSMTRWGAGNARMCGRWRR
jgi:Flp pilus assembly protein TadD